MKILFIGGTGLISTACTRLAVEQGHEMYLLNRGKTLRRPMPAGVKVLHADINNATEAASVLEGQRFDAVVDWIAFVPEQIERDIKLFKGKTSQFIFISSASAYQTPPTSPVITESTPLQNPFWEYSRNKIACEERLMKEYRLDGFPITIVRPSYTYDTIIPTAFGPQDWTIIDRMKRGKEVISHGDGSSLWVMTHNTDFAVGFNGLLGNIQSIGHSFHITSDELLTWDQIYTIIGNAAGFMPKLIHIPCDFIEKLEPDTIGSLHGDKTASVIFDNSKIKRFVPGFQTRVSFAEGMRRAVAWFEEDPRRKTIDQNFNVMYDRIIDNYKRAWNK